MSTKAISMANENKRGEIGSYLEVEICAWQYSVHDKQGFDDKKHNAQCLQNTKLKSELHLSFWRSKLPNQGPLGQYDGKCSTFKMLMMQFPYETVGHFILELNVSVRKIK